MTRSEATRLPSATSRRENPAARGLTALSILLLGCAGTSPSLGDPDGSSPYEWPDAQFRVDDSGSDAGPAPSASEAGASVDGTVAPSADTVAAPQADSMPLPTCGNGALDPGESCDTAIAAGPQACPTAATCTTQKQCTSASVAGAGCAATCLEQPISACQTGDNCCAAGCSYANDQDCPVPAEVLDGKDNDLDGLVDEGFWVDALATSASKLAGVPSPVSACPDGATFSFPCNAAISRYCRSLKYTSGFGPVSYAGGDGTAVCVADAVYVSNMPALSACQGSSRFSFGCSEAIHDFCKSLGHLSGFGPVEGAGDVNSLVCIRKGRGAIYSVPIAALAALNSGCTSVDLHTRACNHAVFKYCKTVKGHDGGVGPVGRANNLPGAGGDAEIVCLNDK